MNSSVSVERFRSVRDALQEHGTLTDIRCTESPQRLIACVSTNHGSAEMIRKMQEYPENGNHRFQAWLTHQEELIDVATKIKSPSGEHPRVFLEPFEGRNPIDPISPRWRRNIEMESALNAAPLDLMVATEMLRTVSDAKTFVSLACGMRRMVQYLLEKEASTLERIHGIAYRGRHEMNRRLTADLSPKEYTHLTNEDHERLNASALDMVSRELRTGEIGLVFVGENHLCKLEEHAESYARSQSIRPEKYFLDEALALDPRFQDTDIATLTVPSMTMLLGREPDGAKSRRQTA